VSLDPKTAGAGPLGGPEALLAMVAAQKKGEAVGVWSVCSAHPAVLGTALELARERDLSVLVEATSNQVNQDGGYTGATPADFAATLGRAAETAGIPTRRVVFGGDHLGPHPWQSRPAAEAMAKAGEMVRQYVRAGAAKIHLDASMRLADDPGGALDPATAAGRTAELCQAAEDARRAEGEGPVYVIGTEVPVPGGERDKAPGLQVTAVDDAAHTLEVTRAAFCARGLESAWGRVVGLVVQPGVEFGDEQVHDYDPGAARDLARFIEAVPGIVYEAHSTDYQRESGLRGLVSDHFAILKVGPWLTFAFREAVFALAAVEREWLGGRSGVPLSRLPEVVDEVMRADPVHWKGYYSGDEVQLRLARAFSLSDRVRYYWPRPEVQAALRRLLTNLEAHPPSPTLLSQYLPGAFRAAREGRIPSRPRDLARWRVREVMELYARACGTPGREG